MFGYNSAESEPIWMKSAGGNNVSQMLSVDVERESRSIAI